MQNRAKKAILSTFGKIVKKFSKIFDKILNFGKTGTSSGFSTDRNGTGTPTTGTGTAKMTGTGTGTKFHPWWSPRYLIFVVFGLF